MVYGNDAIELHIPRRHRVAKNWMRFASSNYQPKRIPHHAAKAVVGGG